MYVKYVKCPLMIVIISQKDLSIYIIFVADTLLYICLNFRFFFPHRWASLKIRANVVPTAMNIIKDKNSQPSSCRLTNQYCSLPEGFKWYMLGYLKTNSVHQTAVSNGLTCLSLNSFCIWFSLSFVLKCDSNKTH